MASVRPDDISLSQYPGADSIASISPFFSLQTFTSKSKRTRAAPMLLVSPMSGHRHMLFSDMVEALSIDRDVGLVAWRNPRDVPVSAGVFDQETSVTCIRKATDAFEARPILIGLCQSVVPVLMAAADMALDDAAETPRGIVLMAGPIDAGANPTGTAALIRSVPLSAYANLLRPVPPPYPGAGQWVLPAALRWSSLLMYALRHATPFDTLFWKLALDQPAAGGDGSFHKAYFTTMDMPGAWLLETLRTVYFDSPVEGLWRRREAALSALSNTALLTIEGARDDVAAPGQTSAAHGLCHRIPQTRRGHIMVPRAGHFDLFHGHTWRTQIAPLIQTFFHQFQ